MLPGAVGEESPGVLVDDDDLALDDLVLLPVEVAVSRNKGLADEFLGSARGAEDARGGA